MTYQAILATPFAALGIRCNNTHLTGIDFLPLNTAEQAAETALASTICQQILAYLANPDFEFSIPLKLQGTDHQQRVWQAMLAIPRGQTRSYGDIAKQLHSAAQAVGQACGANPIPIIVPCHRIVARQGLGGFAKQTGEQTLRIKRWLLQHERTTG